MHIKTNDACRTLPPGFGSEGREGTSPRGEARGGKDKQYTNSDWLVRPSSLSSWGGGQAFGVL